MRLESVLFLTLLFCVSFIDGENFYDTDALFFVPPYFVGLRDGRRVRNGEFSYQVALKHKDSVYCSGVIIADSIILTAAYCIPENRIYQTAVLVGTKDLERGGQIYEVAKGIRHERYNNIDMDFDIGLLKLRRPLSDSPVLQVALLADNGPLFSEGMKFNISGWGWPSMSTRTVSRYLLQSEVLWMNQATCREKRQNSMVALSYRQFCTTMDNSPCMHDFGGPVTWNGVVIGIISGASSLCEVYPPVYTKVSAHKEWIQKKLMELNKIV